MDYPNRDVMFTHTPPIFHEAASKIMMDMGFCFDQITLGSVWSVFEHMLPVIQDEFPPDSFSNSP
jgi:hypothetical protein